MHPEETITSNQLRQRTSSAVAAMSLKSALSSVVSISSLSESSGARTHKRKESFRGEVFVSSYEGGSSIDGSSISSEGGKSSLQESVLSTLLGNHESLTASGSSSDGFPSLAVSGSSLSSNQSAPVLALTVSGTSDALRELTNGIQEVAQGVAIEDTEKEETQDKPQHLVVFLENVEYVASLPHATSCTDLSSMDEPITREMAQCIFSRRIVPSEIPMTADNPSDISTLYGGKHFGGDHELKDEVEEDEQGADIEKGQTETQAATTMEVQVYFPWHQRVLGRRSRTEIFFMLVIGISSAILIILLVIVLR